MPVQRRGKRPRAGQVQILLQAERPRDRCVGAAPRSRIWRHISGSAIRTMGSRARGPIRSFLREDRATLVGCLLPGGAPTTTPRAHLELPLRSQLASVEAFEGVRVTWRGVGKRRSRRRGPSDPSAVPTGAPCLKPTQRRGSARSSSARLSSCGRPARRALRREIGRNRGEAGVLSQAVHVVGATPPSAQHLVKHAAYSKLAVATLLSTPPGSSDGGNATWPLKLSSASWSRRRAIRPHPHSADPVKVREGELLLFRHRGRRLSAARWLSWPSSPGGRSLRWRRHGWWLYHRRLPPSRLGSCSAVVLAFLGTSLAAPADPHRDGQSHSIHACGGCASRTTRGHASPSERERPGCRE